jgi:superoxide reductase
MNKYVCGKCGYLAFKEAPDNCPVCYAPKEAFKQDNDVIKKPADSNNLTEGDKKHVPIIKIVKECGLVDGGCIDAHIKVGEILHVMEDKHYITYIDVYLDYNFIGRYHLVPEKVNPVLGIHLKVSNGKLIALENCNVHGRWVSEAEI